MRRVDLSPSAPRPGDPARLARLTRHLAARLEDFGPGGPQVRLADQQRGLVLASFPGRTPESVAEPLARRFGVLARTEGDCVLFQLSPQLPFEDLDYVWGCLFALLCG